MFEGQLTEVLKLIHLEIHSKLSALLSYFVNQKSEMRLIYPSI